MALTTWPRGSPVMFKLFLHLDSKSIFWGIYIFLRPTQWVCFLITCCFDYMDRVKRTWFFSPMRAAKIQASLRIRAVSPEPPLLANASSESRGTFRQKARSLAPLNGWACAVKICHDGMLEDTNSLDGARICIPVRPLKYDTRHERLSLNPMHVQCTIFRTIPIHLYN